MSLPEFDPSFEQDTYVHLPAVATHLDHTLAFAAGAPTYWGQMEAFHWHLDRSDEPPNQGPCITLLSLCLSCYASLATPLLLRLSCYASLAVPLSLKLPDSTARPPVIGPQALPVD